MIGWNIFKYISLLNMNQDQIWKELEKTLTSHELRLVQRYCQLRLNNATDAMYSYYK